MKTRIHVNKHKIASNKKHGKNEPVITVKTYKTNTYGHEAEIRDDEGNTVAKVIYSPEKPLNCGAVLWVETELKVIVK